MLSSEDIGEIEPGGLGNLPEGARAWVSVGTPPDKLRGMTEAIPFHVVVSDLYDALRSERHKRQVLAGAPAAELCAARGAGRRLLPGTVPRMTLQCGDEGLELLEQRAALLNRKRCYDSYVHEVAVVVIKAEQQRADSMRVGLVWPIAGYHTVGRSDVLDLEHHPFIRLVARLERFGDDAVEPRALELVEPPFGYLGIIRDGSEVDRRLSAAQDLLEHAASHPERFSGEVTVAKGEQIERDVVRGGLPGKQLDSAFGRMDPLLQDLEVKAPKGGIGHDDLPVDNAAIGQPQPDCRYELREVAGHRSEIAAADLDLVAVAKDDRAEPVPLGLVDIFPPGDVLDKPCEHRGNVRHNRQVHARLTSSLRQRTDLAISFMPVASFPKSYPAGH